MQCGERLIRLSFQGQGYLDLAAIETKRGNTSVAVTTRKRMDKIGLTVVIMDKVDG
ncbi:hypothetical protein [Desulfosporosinus sp. SB140]|uniref:hypothetical protein n=1 Tax=Desulfosporosinus paludis TaxID=3115649 RepID=UPI00388F2F39